jgi:hypothetical protein
MEYCPVCLLRKGLADGVESGESSLEGAGKPTTPEKAVPCHDLIKIEGQWHR